MQRNGFSLAAAILGSLYLVFSTVFFSGNGLLFPNVSSNGPVAAIFSSGAAFNVFACAAAVSFNWAAWWSSSRTPMMVAAILYCVAAAFFLVYTFFLALPIIFSWVSFAQMRRFDRGYAEWKKQNCEKDVSNSDTGSHK